MSGSWETESSIKGKHMAAEATLVGFVVQDDKEGISLTMGRAITGECAGQFFVPRGMIKKITKVKY